jgi:hypothetical protein
MLVSPKPRQMALNRHRGKGGQQKVTVEHVHVHAGGQAVVGVVEGLRKRGALCHHLDHGQAATHARDQQAKPRIA